MQASNVRCHRARLTSLAEKTTHRLTAEVLLPMQDTPVSLYQCWHTALLLMLLVLPQLLPSTPWRLALLRQLVAWHFLKQAENWRR